MHQSLNFLVELNCPLDNSAPTGFEFTNEFKSRLGSMHTITREVDNWRDVGWDFVFSAGDEEYSAVLSGLAEDNKLLIQVSPTRVPNIIMRLLGCLPSANDVGLDRRRFEIDEVLASNPKVVHVEFAYDRFP